MTWNRKRTRQIQFFCLLAALVMEGMLCLTEDRGGGIAWTVLENYLTIPALIFLGTAICGEQTRRTKTVLLLGAATIIWFIAVQLIHRFMGMNMEALGMTAGVYALALPFAAVTQDGQRQRGLCMTGILVLGIGGLLLIYGLLLILGRLPEYLRFYVAWDGARFSAMGHPNICATLLMTSIAFCAAFFVRVRNRWCKGLLAVLAALEFALMTLTNGRTSIIITCALLGGIVFCALRGSGWKRFVLALLIGMTVAAVLFGVSQQLFRAHEAYRTQLAIQAQETGIVDENTPRLDEKGNLETVSQQSSLKESMGSLNGRTKIWRAILDALGEDSHLMLVGTEYVDLLIERGNLPFAAAHAHNSWLEVLCKRGAIGLILALVLTGLAVRNAVVLLWRNEDLWESCTAMLSLGLLCCAVLEPYLFTDAVPYYFFDFLFMLCLGYMNQWCGQKSWQRGEIGNV